MCFKCFQTYVWCISSGYCIYCHAFISMFQACVEFLHMFCTYIISDLSGCCKNRSRCRICCYPMHACFKHIKSFIIFSCMLQMFHLMSTESGLLQSPAGATRGLPMWGAGWMRGTRSCYRHNASAAWDADVGAWCRMRTRDVGRDTGGEAASGP